MKQKRENVMNITKKLSDEDKKKLLEGIKKHSEKYLFGSKHTVKKGKQ